MKFICTQQELNTRLDIVKNAIPSKTTMSILQYIFIEATASQVRFVANDMENGIETTLSATVEEEGYVAIEASLISSIVKALPEADVTISTDAGFMVSVDCEKTHYNLPGRSGDDFTFPPEIKEEDGIEIRQSTLKTLIAQTIFSISTNDTNKIMTGELFEVDGEVLRMISLDGHRISLRKTLLNKKYKAKKAIVPGRTLQKIRNILSDQAEKMLLICFTEKHICFRLEDTIMVSRLIDGEYFDVAQMMNGDYETKVSVSRKEFIRGIEQAFVLAQEGDKKPIILNISGDEMELKVNSTRGSMNSFVSVELQGKDIMIGFNPRFLTDALRVIEDEKLDVYFMNPKAPCFIRNSDSTYVYMVLPINFKTVD